MLCSRFHAPPARKKHGRVYAASERVFALAQSLRLSLRGSSASDLHPNDLSIVLLVARFYIFIPCSKGFLSSEDSGSFWFYAGGPQGISVESDGEHQLAITSIVAQDPNVANTFSLPARALPGLQETPVLFLSSESLILSVA